jgi:ACS family allantoate permease-like MFS transporter
MTEGTEKSPPLQFPVSIDDGRHIDERILKHSHDADVALQAIQQADGQVIEIDAATNKRLLRIIDWHLMPLMCVVYGMNYLDSTSSPHTHTHTHTHTPQYDAI